MPMPMVRMQAMAKEAGTEVAPGENSVGASLDVVFELGK
jgi:uncharacterized protein YggE